MPCPNRIEPLRDAYDGSFPVYRPDLADIFSKACQARASASVCIHYQNRCLTYASRLLAIATGKFIIETPAPAANETPTSRMEMNSIHIL